MKPLHLNRTLLLLALAMPFSTIPLVAQVTHKKAINDTTIKLRASSVSGDIKRIN